MSEEQISEILHMPLDKLLKVCDTPRGLTAVLCLAVNAGIAIGQMRVIHDYNTMFKGYNEASINN